MSETKKKLTLENIDLMKYILSIVVIVLHLRPFLAAYPTTDYIFNTGLGRLCVPFFFFVSGFLVSTKHMEEPGYIKKYIKGHLKSYYIWSLIYLPLLILFAFEHKEEIVSVIQSLPLSTGWLIVLSPIIAILGTLVLLLYSGTFYHLWFFPALFASLFIIHLWRKKWNSVIVLMIIAFAFYLFGATETYWGYLAPTVQSAIEPYYAIFYTTRNFLFFGLFFVALGYHVAQKDTLEHKYTLLKLIVAIVFFAAEVYFLKDSNRKDSNILLFTIPVTYYLFIWLANMKEIPTMLKKTSFRNLSQYLYLVHPYVIFFVAMLPIDVIGQTVLVLVLCHIIAYGIIEFLRWKRTKKTLLKNT